MSNQEQNEYVDLIQKHNGIIHKVIGLYVDNEEDRKDLHQEVLLQAWKSYKNFKGQSVFSTWLYKVALNTVLTFNKQEIMDAIKMESHSSIVELKKRLKYKLFWSSGFTLLFATMLLFFLGNVEMILLLGIGVAAYTIGTIGMYFKYRQIEDNISGTTDILASMKYNAKMIKSVLKLEKVWGLVVFIPAITMGILAGRVLDGHTLASCFQDPKILTIIIGSIVVFTPLLIWSSNKMNKIAFGENLEKLESNIIKMETLM